MRSNLVRWVCVVAVVMAITANAFAADSFAEIEGVTTEAGKKASEDAILPLASEEVKKPSAGAVVADAVFVRPVGVASVIVGSVFYVISYPVAAATKGTGSTAELLVKKPVKATFKRPLGDLDAMAD